MMKKCLICGKAMPDTAEFCDVCYGPLGVVEGTEAPAPTAEPAAAPAAGGYTAPVSEPTPKKKRKSLKRLWLSLVALVLCVALVLGWFTNCFGLFAPWGYLGRSALRLIKAESAIISFRMEMDDGGDDVENTEGALYVVLDEDAEELVAYLDMEQDGRGYVCAIDGDRMYEYRTSEDNVVTTASIDEVDSSDFFDAREDFLDEIKDRDQDWEDVIDDLGLEDYLDDDEMDKFVRQLNRKYFGNIRWLKKNMGYSRTHSRKGTTFSFDIDPETFLEALLDIVDESDAFTRKAKREIGDALEEALDYLDEEDVDVDIRFSFTVKGGQLSNIHAEMSGSVDGEEGRVELDVGISDINKTEVSQDDIRDVRGVVNHWLEVEGIEYDECEDCSDFGQVEYYDGRYLCDDCGYYYRRDEYDWYEYD